jgi:EAL domain-containing protein (putative c-di-GMP-specific phosphodiesterase class I)
VAERCAESGEDGASSVIEGVTDSDVASVVDVIDVAALDRDRLTVHFQPIMDLTDGHVVGVESLLRSQHPLRGTLTATELFGLRVNAPIRGHLADRAFTIAADAWADLRAEFGDAVPDLHVNLDPTQLEATDLVARVRHVLVACDLPPDRLVLEVTDPDAGTDPPAALDRVAELVDGGVRLALDRFGSSSAALGWLRERAVSMVKVEAGLIAAAADDERSARLLDHLVAICGELGVTAIATGLEDDLLVEVAVRSGMRIGQGYAVRRPLDVDDLAELIGSAVVEHR